MSQLITANQLGQDLNKLGIKPGMLLMVHSSLSSLGRVLGGAELVVGGLLNVVGKQGTLVMPAATPLCGDPAVWFKPKLNADELSDTREHLPLFNRETTATTLGIIPETFRNWPDTLRSDHPLESVCANGPLATEITAQHSLAFSEGIDGPFGKLYELDAWILLLGVGFNRCTALHFAESLSPKKRTTTVSFPIVKNGIRQWLEVPNVADDNDTHFPLIGEQYIANHSPTRGCIGIGQATLFRMRELVDFAVEYFEHNF